MFETETCKLSMKRKQYGHVRIYSLDNKEQHVPSFLLTNEGL